MKNILPFLLLLLFNYAHSQEQVTNFEDDSTKSPKNLLYLGTINNKALFTAFTPETGNEIWVSNGTEQGTQLLKDINSGELSTYPYSFVIHNSWAYFLTNGNLWKTDGTSENTFEVAKQDIENRIYFASLSILDNKVLLVSTQYIKTQLATFSWVLPSNKIEKWEDEVVGYSIENNSLFYSKMTDSIPTYTIYHYLQSSKVIYSTKKWITGISQFKNNSDIYCSLTTSYSTDLQRTLIKIDENQKSENQILDWGNHQNSVPLYTKNDNGDFYLIKSHSYKNNSDSLFLYKSYTDGLLLTHKINGKEINPTFGYYSGGDKFFSNTIFQNDKLFYVNGFHTEGAVIFYCNYIDFKSNIFKQTNTNHADSYATTKVSVLNDSLFKVSTSYATFIYNLKSNLITGKAFKAFTNEKTFLELNYQKFEISDNVYKLIGNDKSPLIQQKKIYFTNYNSNLRNIRFNGKQYILYENYTLKKCELWVLDELGTKKIKSFKNINYGSSLFQVKNLSDKLFFTVLDSLNYNIYQTDGTTDGTTLAYSFSKKDRPLYIGPINDSYIRAIYDNKYIFISKGRIDEISLNVGYGYDFFTSENIYFIRYIDAKATLYKLEKGKLIALFTSNNITDPFIFENRLYFKSEKQLNYLNEAGEIVNISRNVDYFTKSNDYLVYREYSHRVDWVSFYNHFILDLRTNKVVSNYIADVSNISFYFKDYVGAYRIGNSKIVVFDGKDTYDVLSLNTGSVNNPILYKNGFFFQYSTKSNTPDILVYYDLQEKRFYTILNNSPSFSIQVNEKSDFILIQQYVSDSERKYSIWSYQSKTLKQVPILKNEYFSDIQAGNYVKSHTNTQSFLWSYANDNLLRQEPIRKKLNEVKLEDIIAYETKFLPEQGNELFAIGNGFSITFPEIVKGTEGIILGTTFIFNNQLYAYLFTYTHGWQVWRMGQGNETLPLGNEDDIVNISLFPNPTTDNVNILSQSPYNYKVFNLLGQEVLNGTVNTSQTLNISSLPQGLYIFQFYDGLKTFTKKIVKQ